MNRSNHPNPETDPFRPPTIPTEVCCMHCGGEYESYLIQWQQEWVDGELVGFWSCPLEGCEGRGFGFDIFPTDPDYRGEDGQPLWADPELEEALNEAELEADDELSDWPTSESMPDEDPLDWDEHFDPFGRR